MDRAGGRLGAGLVRRGRMGREIRPGLGRVRWRACDRVGVTVSELDEGRGDRGPGMRRVIEAVLMVAEEPVDPGLLAQVLEEPRDDIVDALDELAADYEREGRGFVLREVGGGW